jgi:hypothetical protein
VAGVVFVVWRLLNAVVNVGVNAMLLVAYNWTSRPARMDRIAGALALFGPIPIAGGLLGHVLAVPDLITYALLLFGLMFYIVAGAITVRAANAGVQSKAILTKSLVDAALSAAVITFLFVSPSVSGFFAAYLVSQGATLSVLGIAKRDYRRTIAGVAAVALTAPLLLSGW